MEKIIYKIQTNKIKCKKCGDIIESKYIHDFKMCKCNSVGVDGGHEYLKRIVQQKIHQQIIKILLHQSILIMKQKK